MINAIEALGRKTEFLWRKARRKKSVFPEIAAQALKEINLVRSFRLETFIREFWKLRKFPRQLSLQNDFGQPPLTLYRAKDFVIDLYFWVKPEISIHSHGFEGAFTVLQGRSLHCRYDFLTQEELGGEAIVGKLSLREAVLLHPEDVVEIPYGAQFIHQVWHISRPTVSLVIRTRFHTPKGFLQFTYLKPHLAVLSHHNLSPLRFKQMMTLLMIRQTDRKREGGHFRRLLSHCRAGEALLLLAWYQDSTNDFALVERITKQLPRIRRHAFSLMDYLRRTRDCQCRWSEVTKEGERLLLSLLNSMESRQDILRFIKLYAPQGEPTRLAVKWLSGLVKNRRIRFDISDTGLEMLRLTLLGLGVEEIVKRLIRTYEGVKPERLRSDYLSFLKKIKRNQLMKGLVTETGDKFS